MKYLTIAVAFLMVSLTLAEDVTAQRRGGGGGRSFSGGGGRSFSGGAGGARSYGGSGFSGGARNYSGGMSRPSSMPTFNRPTPSYQRPGNAIQGRGNAGSIQRPMNSGQIQRPSMSGNLSGRSSVQRPQGQRIQNAQGQGLSRSQGIQQRTANDFRGASKSQLNDFLNMPAGKSGARTTGDGRSRAASAGTPNDSGGRSFQGENYSVDTFKGKGSGSKDGVNYGGAGAGVVITDSQGNQRVVGKGAGGATDGTNTVAGKGKVAAGTNVDGSAGAVRSGTRVATDGNSVGVSRGVAGASRDSQGNVRGGAAGGRIATDGQNVVGSAGMVRGQSNVDGSGGYVARGARGATDGQNTVVQRGAQAEYRDRYGNQGGARVGGTRRTDAYGNRSTQVRGARYYKGPGGFGYARSVHASGYNGIITNYNQANFIRRGFPHYGYYYSSRWYARYPGAWFAAGVVASAWWSTPNYGYVTGYTGCAQEPVSYDYGNDGGIYVENGNVYVGSEVLASEEEYYEQAVEIADQYDDEPAASDVDKADDEPTQGDWMPLGVFAVVTEGQTKSDTTLQLAISRDGIVRGNLSLELTDEVLPIKGALDKETQRVAFRIEGKEDVLAECGLYNLTQDVLTVLVHKGKEEQTERGLVRLTQDDESGDDGNAEPTPENSQQ